jgi:hypothetical protein
MFCGAISRYSAKSRVAPRRSHTEALNQIWATDLTEEVEPEVDVGQPLALGVAQALDALGLSHRRLLIQDGRLNGWKRKFDCSLVGASHHQKDDILRQSLCPSKKSKWPNRRIHALQAKALLSGSDCGRGFGSVFRHHEFTEHRWRQVAKQLGQVLGIVH